jgi:hypothetical protein
VQAPVPEACPGIHLAHHKGSAPVPARVNRRRAGVSAYFEYALADMVTRTGAKLGYMVRAPTLPAGQSLWQSCGGRNTPHSQWGRITAVDHLLQAVRMFGVATNGRQQQISRQRIPPSPLIPSRMHDDHEKKRRDHHALRRNLYPSPTWKRCSHSKETRHREPERRSRSAALLPRSPAGASRP